MSNKSEWLTMNDNLKTASLEQVEDMLNREILGKHRVAFMLRIHGRMNVLRGIKERAQLVRHANSK
jgi:hypothetical protein